VLRALAPTVLFVGCLLLWIHGFLGVSNDDAARALIAWDTAHAPTIDPTRSSWLPLHSLLLAALMAIGGSPCIAPFVASFGGGLVALAALGRALRREALDAWTTPAALALVVAWRWSLFSAAAGGVPEMPAVALVCVALERWTSRSPGAWWQAGLALTLACGFRYEAWFAVVGFALAAAAHERARSKLPATLAVAAVVPLAWLLLNHLHRGDALDFAHRVAAHRRAVSPTLAPWWERPLTVAATTLRELPWVALLVVQVRTIVARSRLASLGGAMALAVWVGLALEAARGGGATHHPARTLLPVAWLLAPALAAAFDGLRARRHALVAAALACAAWGAPRPGELAAMGAPDAAAVGAEVRRRWPVGRWCLELGRQDALWVEWRSGASRRTIPDRVFGEAPGDAAARAGACLDARGAVTSSGDLEKALRAVGFRLARRRGPWALLERPR
jgi:hypothetical protein